MNLPMRGKIKMPECFTIYADKIEGRIDPYFYRPEFGRYYEILLNNKEIIRGKDIFIKIESGIGVKPENLTNEGLRYIEVNSISPLNVSKDNSFVDENERIKILDKGDMVTGRVGSVGNFALFEDDEKVAFSDNILRIKLKQNINKKFILFLLNSSIVKKQIDRYKKGSLQSVINQQTLNSLILILPPLTTQNRIVSLMDSTYSSKKSKKTESQKLLDSINDYVLDELGIKLPELKDKMCFVVDSEEVKNNRIDPRYYKPHFKDFEKELSKRKDIKNIGEISEYVGSGSTPMAGGDDYTSNEEGIPFIRIVNLKNNTIVLDDALYIKKEIHEGMLKRTQLKPNDVLLSMAGTIGLSVIVPENLGEANINQAIARIVLKDNINPFYLSALLNSKIGKFQTDRLSRPSVQANINLEEIRALKIPLPPLSVQNKIADEVKKRMQKAESLQKEAKEELEKAKLEVEKIILG